MSREPHVHTFDQCSSCGALADHLPTLRRVEVHPLLDAEQAEGLAERLREAHLTDRLSKCGCSLQTLRVCTGCGRVTCRCERYMLGPYPDGRCPCVAD